MLYKYPLVLLYCIENYIFVFQIVGFMEFIKEAGVSPQKSMDIKNDKITIKPLRDKDVDIFSKWLAKEYIYKWFCLNVGYILWIEIIVIFINLQE